MLFLCFFGSVTFIDLPVRLCSLYSPEEYADIYEYSFTHQVHQISHICWSMLIVLSVDSQKMFLFWKLM